MSNPYTQSAFNVSISQEKMAKFINGGYQKKKVLNEQNEKLAKIKKEEEEAGATYQKFIQACEGGGDSSMAAPMFVKGGSINSKGIAERDSDSSKQTYIIGGSTAHEESTSAPTGQTVVPIPELARPKSQQTFSFTYTKEIPTKATMKSKTTDLMSMFGDHDEDEDERAKERKELEKRMVNRKTNIHYAIHNTTQKTQLETVHETLKRQQEASIVVSRDGKRSRFGMKEMDTTRSSAHDDETVTTSIYVGNIPKSLSELDIYVLFAYYGYVKAVTLRTPHLEDPTQIANTRIGFVEMATRKEAEIAFKNLQDHPIGKYTLRLGWSKGRGKLLIPGVPPGSIPISVHIPTSPAVRDEIELAAEFIHTYGAPVEIAMRKESETRRKEYLQNENCEEGVYFRYCLLVLGNNETIEKRSLQPFQFFTNGSWYIPPPVYDPNREEAQISKKLHELKKAVAEVSNRQDESDDERERLQKRRQIQGSNLILDDIRIHLPDDRFDAFCDYLRTITPSRADILRIMAFCMDNCKCAEHIVCILRDSICDNVPYFQSYFELEKSNVSCGVPVRMARLYVVNDLLYNADNGCITAFRSLLQTELPMIMESFCRLRHNCESNVMKQEIKSRIEKMIGGWSKHALLATMFIRGLRATFLMSIEELDSVIDETTSEEKEDELRLRCRMNGLANYGTKGQLLKRLSILEKMMEEEYQPEVEEIESDVALDPELDGESLDKDYEESLTDSKND